MGLDPAPTTNVAADVEEFQPDHDLVLKVAEHITTFSDYTATEAVFIAYGVLIYLNDEMGIEIPEHGRDDGR